MPDWLSFAIVVVVQVFMTVGLVGLLIPIFPGITIIWLSALGYGIAAGFGRLGLVLFIIITVLFAIGTVIDNIFMGAGARKGGASWNTIILAVLAGVVGTFVVPPVGGLIAAPLVVLGLEYRRLGDWEKARQALMGLLTGWGLSFVVRFVIGLVMMALWWLWVWRG